LAWRREWDTINPFSPSAWDTSGVYGNVYRDRSGSDGAVNGENRLASLPFKTPNPCYG